ncbi:MAG: tetratricopeptide repeat protein [Streptosporangiaceae bacterium]
MSDRAVPLTASALCAIFLAVPCGQVRACVVRSGCLGEVQAARDQDQDTLDRRRGVLGPDHPDTLASAANLATYLRELGEADDGP